MSGAGEIRIRAAAAPDVHPIHAMIVELATYEHSADQVTGTVQQLADALFGTRPSAEALIAQDGAAIGGFALFYTSFSTWECRPGIWLEDLFVRPQHRRAGVGGRLLGELARAHDRPGISAPGMERARLERARARVLRESGRGSNPGVGSAPAGW